MLYPRRYDGTATILSRVLFATEAKAADFTRMLRQFPAVTELF